MPMRAIHSPEFKRTDDRMRVELKTGSTGDGGGRERKKEEKARCIGMGRRIQIRVGWIQIRALVGPSFHPAPVTHDVSHTVHTHLCQVRRAQAAIAKVLEAKDAAEKERLKQLSKDLKGRDYSYDHKGEVRGERGDVG